MSNRKTTIKTAVFSWHEDKPIDIEDTPITNETIIIVDGVFLFHPILVNRWDYKIFLDADISTVLERGLDRDSNTPEERVSKGHEYDHCYYAGQRLYLKKAQPANAADLVIKYNDYNKPVIIDREN